jgi:hypothetical protein
MNQAAKGTKFDEDALVDLLESIDHFLMRVGIYTRMPATPEMHEMVFNIIVELLSTLALATKEFRQGRSSESFFAGTLALLNTRQSHSSSKERTTFKRFWRGSTGSHKTRLRPPQFRHCKSFTVSSRIGGWSWTVRNDTHLVMYRLLSTLL